MDSDKRTLIIMTVSLVILAVLELGLMWGISCYLDQPIIPENPARSAAR